MYKKVLRQINLADENVLTKIELLYKGDSKTAKSWEHAKCLVEYYTMHVNKELLHKFEFVIYKGWEAEIICLDGSLLIEDCILNATRSEVSKHLLEHKDCNAYQTYDLYRTVFSRIKPKKTKVYVERVGNLITLTGLTSRHFDIGAYLKAYTPTEEEKAKGLVSGLYDVLHPLYKNGEYEPIEITSFDRGNKVMEVQVSHPDMCTSHCRDSVEVSLNSLLSIGYKKEEAIRDVIENYEESELLGNLLYSVVEELCFNYLIHGDSCPFVRISWIENNGNPLPLFNYAKKEVKAF